MSEAACHNPNDSIPDEGAQSRFARYQELQQYAAWTADDALRIRSLAPLLQSHLPALVQDFYEEIERHPAAARVITGGQEQIVRLKGTLLRWLEELLEGTYDANYVSRRWRVGLRHVEIGLDQVYTNMALSRLRSGLVQVLIKAWPRKPEELAATQRSLHKLLDLDLAIIEDAYQAEYLRRQQQVERMATIGQVAGGIAHELRNPLNVIKTSVYYLLNARSLTPEKTSEHLHRIHNQVGQADGVITALSNFARLPIPNLEPFDLKSMLQKSLDASMLPESIIVTLDVEPGDHEPLGDAAQLQIVFSNLFRNARDAMPNGGRLKVTAVPGEDGIPIRVEDTLRNRERAHPPRDGAAVHDQRGIGLKPAIACHCR
ncbi:MAG: protoglobin domain-containing protein [Planctomycetaceae bacterium]